jgi:hypothetical protein
MDFDDYSKFLFFVLWALYMLVRRGIRAASARKARQEAAQREQAPPDVEGLADEEEWWEPAILEEEFELESAAELPESELTPEIGWGPPADIPIPVREEEIPSPPPLPARAPNVARRRKRFRLMGAEPLPLLIRDGLVVGAILEGRRRGGRPSRGVL